MALLNLYSLTYTVSEDEMKAEVSTAQTLSAPLSGKKYIYTYIFI
jgi:hypothetical protein